MRITYDPPESRQTITDLRGESLLREGTQVGIGDFPDTVRVINIWGSWCGPCRTEAPELQAVADAAKGKAVVLGIDVRDDRQAALDFVTDRGITYDSIYDAPGRTLARLDGYPRNVVPRRSCSTATPGWPRCSWSRSEAPTCCRSSPGWPPSRGPVRPADPG